MLNSLHASLKRRTVKMMFINMKRTSSLREKQKEDRVFLTGYIALSK